MTMPQSSDYIHDEECRRCGTSYDSHPRCQCCGIYCGPNHFQVRVSSYRGQLLCGLCIGDWERLEKKVGRKVPWEEFPYHNRYYAVDGRRLKAVRHVELESSPSPR